jgi:drug/metabolite transporter superfamily protein YnfA
MNEKCPVCGLMFAREPGYFLGAMYFGYGLGIPVLASLAWLWFLALPQWPWHWLVLPALVCFIPLLPAIFRYSRTLWIYFDRRFDP